MAKFKLKPIVPDGVFLADIYPGGNPLVFDRHAGDVAILISQENENRDVVLLGENFSYSADDALTGTITSVSFRDPFGNVYGKVTDLNLDVFELATPLIGYTLFDLILEGDDVVRGSVGNDSMAAGNGSDVLFGLGGDDRISGDLGDDRYTGGKGSDTFFGGTRFGHDVVTDFDADGGGTDQDYIEVIDPYTIVKSGRDTLIVFDDGADITLLGVRRSHVTDEDITMF